MRAQVTDTERLLNLAVQGDVAARERLLDCFRVRLKRMIAVRLDPRLAARVDPSDVVQEALFEATRKLDDYLTKRPVPFYPWLRRLAWEQLLKVHEKHLRARRRSVAREERVPMDLSDPSADLLADRLIASDSSPSVRLIRDELRRRVRQALAGLPEPERDVLIMRYLEEMSNAEIASALDVSEGAVKMRHRRALNRLAAVLGNDLLGDP